MNRYTVHDRQVHPDQSFGWRDGERWAILDRETGRYVDEAPTRDEAARAARGLNEAPAAEAGVDPAPPLSGPAANDLVAAFEDAVVEYARARDGYATGYLSRVERDRTRDEVAALREILVARLAGRTVAP